MKTPGCPSISGSATASATTTGIDFSTLTLQDALDLAILIEEEARQRYEEFTRIVGGRYAGDAADMFKLMAAAETKHGNELAAQRRRIKRLGTNIHAPIAGQDAAEILNALRYQVAGRAPVESM